MFLKSFIMTETVDSGSEWGFHHENSTTVCKVEKFQSLKWRLLWGYSRWIQNPSENDKSLIKTNFAIILHISRVILILVTAFFSFTYCSCSSSACSGEVMVKHAGLTMMVRSKCWFKYYLGKILPVVSYLLQYTRNCIGANKSYSLSGQLPLIMAQSYIDLIDKRLYGLHS